MLCFTVHAIIQCCTILTFLPENLQHLNNIWKLAKRFMMGLKLKQKNIIFHITSRHPPLHCIRHSFLGFRQIQNKRGEIVRKAASIGGHIWQQEAASSRL
jgi:hypothetical protein